MRLSTIKSLLCTSVGAALFLISPTSLMGSPLLLSRLAGAAPYTSAQNDVERYGGSVRHRFPPDHLIVDVDDAHVNDLARSLGDGWVIADGPVSNPSGAAENAWNRMFEREAALSKVHKTGTPLNQCVHMMPPTIEAPAQAKASSGATYGAYGAGFWDGSEYMLGDVAVAVILPESNGTTDPNQEDWTPAEETHVTNQVVEAMDWWIDQTHLGPLTFTYEYHYDVDTDYEPITHPQSEENIWIEDALKTLGYDGPDRFTMAQLFVNDLKDAYDTDWAFLIFVADSEVDDDGLFASGHFAYAYLGGPFMVLTLDNNGWGQANFSAVCAHETGHIFYALDEYYNAGSACTDESGYLLYQNQNSQYGSCAEDVPTSIMRSVPLSVATVSSSARGMIGWADADGDSVPDVFDTSPTVQITYAAKTSATANFRVEGTAHVSPIANLNTRGYGNDISANEIQAVQFRVDGGAWVNAVPDDGVWDSGSEGFSFEPTAPSEGQHDLEVRGLNNRNIQSAAYYEDSFDFLGVTSVTLSGGDGVPVALRLLGNRPNPFNPKTSIALRVDGALPASVVVYDAAGRLVRTLFAGILPEGDNVIVWDGVDDRGRPSASGRYHYRVDAGGGSAVGSMLLVR